MVDEVIVRNPCQVARAGIERAAERPVASVGDVQALADAIAPRFRLVVLLGAWCGLRRGELLALRRGDIDLDHATVRVERAVQHRQNGTLEFGPPKTDAGRRTVAIPPHLTPEVTAHLERFTGPEADSLVFTGEKGGPVRPHVLQKAWVAAKDTTGLTQLHLHDLRHSGNTWAAATGASTKELMARMGHASAQAAIAYQHATAERDQAIAAALSSLVPAAKPTRAAKSPAR
ncbi:MAG: site-specific integrase [Actinomycetota bacterium]|nr:site-specific integrase [Actinomycetota bacterium]